MQTLARYLVPKNPLRRAQSSATEAEVYDSTIRWLHWSMAAGIIPCVALVKLAQDTQDNVKKGQLMFYHKSIGLTMLGLIFPRLYLSMTRKAPALPNPNVLLQYASLASHKLFYALLVFLPLSGVTMGYYGGRGLPFWWTTIPGKEKPDGAIAKSAYSYHKKAGVVLEYLIPLHLLGVVAHLARGEKILQRINPLYKAVKN
jgi:cytochrome b561